MGISVGPPMLRSFPKHGQQHLEGYSDENDESNSGQDRFHFEFFL